MPENDAFIAGMSGVRFVRPHAGREVWEGSLDALALRSRDRRGVSAFEVRVDR